LRSNARRLDPRHCGPPMTPVLAVPVSTRPPHWVKVKNPKAPAVTREAEEDWGK